jgi:hypothetical protein
MVQNSNKWRTNNANTSDDRTIITSLSNNLELALWMESERLMHPVIINQIGGYPKRSHKRRKSSRYDNRPYGKVINVVKTCSQTILIDGLLLAPWNI